MTTMEIQCMIKLINKVHSQNIYTTNEKNNSSVSYTENNNIKVFICLCKNMWLTRKLRISIPRDASQRVLNMIRNIIFGKTINLFYFLVDNYNQLILLTITHHDV